MTQYYGAYFEKRARSETCHNEKFFKKKGNKSSHRTNNKETQNAKTTYFE